MSERKPVAEGLFTWPSDEPQLIGARCTGCGVVTFPAQRSCPSCTGTEMAAELLPRRGTLWTWTVQGFLPKSPPYKGPETPKDFAPYGVGYVELRGAVKVETRLTTADPAELRIGREMELVILPFTTADGDELVTFAFQPV